MGVRQQEIPVQVSNAVVMATRSGGIEAREEFSAIVGACVAGSVGLATWVLALIAVFAIVA